MNDTALRLVSFDRARLDRLLAEQHGVVSRAQLVECRAAPHDIERLLRRRELARLMPGVYLDHTGEPSWLQRAWAGVLHAWPAALAGRAAMRARAGPGWQGFVESAPIQIALPETRRVRPVPGYRFERRRGFEAMVQWNRHPPRLRIEEVVLDLAIDAPADLESVAVLAQACQRRITTAPRLRERLALRRRAPRRGWLSGLLDDIGSGTCSVLEHGYLDRVERPHRLPVGNRQARGRHAGRVMFQDVRYERERLVIELDGRLFHDSAEQRDLDLERDLAVMAGDGATLRLGWGQVFGRPCTTAGIVGGALRQRGWDGTVAPCGPDCAAGGL